MRRSFSYAKRLYNSKGFNRYKRAIGTAAAVAAQRSFTRTKTKTKRTTSGVGITQQYDRRKVYQKRYMPKAKRRRWKKFIQKVNAVDEKDLGSQTFLFNHTVTASTIDPVKQILASVALYSGSSTNNWLSDMSQLSGTFNYANPTAAADDYINSTSKCIFKSAVLDVTVRNTSDNNAGVTVDIPLEVDVYEITCNFGQDDSADTWNKIEDYFTRAANDTLNVGGTVGNSVTLDARGATPWELPTALSLYRIKIMKKTKYFIGVGQTFTYQVRDPTRHVYTFGTMNRLTSVNVNGLTRHYLFIAKPVPGITAGATVRPKLSIGVTRKYLAKVEGLRTNRDILF